MRKNTKKLIREFPNGLPDEPMNSIDKEKMKQLQELFPTNYERVLKFFQKRNK